MYPPSSSDLDNLGCKEVQHFLRVGPVLIRLNQYSLCHLAPTHKIKVITLKNDYYRPL